MAMSKSQVEKDLGEIIVANNPGPGLMQPVSNMSSLKNPPYGQQKGFTGWPVGAPVHTGIQQFIGQVIGGTGYVNPTTYLLEKVYEIDYVTDGEAVNPTTGKRPLHRLWIIYGSGGE